MPSNEASRKKLNYWLGDDNQDDQMHREQDMPAPSHDPRRPSTGVSLQDNSGDRANKPGRRALTDAKMNQGQEPVHRRLKSGYITRTRSSFQPFTCKSPSTDSTTSLAQLRDKLTVLSPLLFNKVLNKIATSPELPVLNEIDERENLSNSLPKTKRCGVTLKYHSDSEAQAQIIKRTRPLSPVVEEHSASLILRTLDASLTNDFIERLYKDNPNFDLPGLFLEEALHHGQKIDSGIIAGKVTQDSDVVENTPVEKDVWHKQLTTSIVQDKPAFNESEVEVIEDTPCYVYDRKKRVRTKNTKADKIISGEIVNIDETAIDALFSQHVNENNTENVISPTLAEKINETSSEASDDDCIIYGNHFMEEELSVNNLFFEADIVDCVNSVIDKVCNDLDKCSELLAEQERHIDNISCAKNIEDNSNITSDIFKMSKDKLKSDKDKSYEHNTEGTKKVTLKFKQSKKVAPKMNTRKKAAKNDKDPTDVGKSNERKNKEESTNTSSPLNATKLTLTRKKRKLYSPKDDQDENNDITTLKTRVERRQSNVNEASIATCYRYLENARQSHSRISKKSKAIIQAKKSKKSLYNMSSESDGEDPSFQIRKRTSTSSIGSPLTMSIRERPMKIVNYIDAHYSTMHSPSEDDDFKHNKTMKPKTAKKIKPRSRKVEKTSRTRPILSPKTKKINEMFDKIKDTVVNDEKITLVEKKSVDKDPSLYNLSSESEDGDFKKIKNQVQKRISSSSLESSATKRRRLMNRVNYSKYYLSEDENEGTQKSKTLKQAKPRSRKTNRIPKFNLIDERMRAVHEETFETSFVKDTVDMNNLDEPEPALQQAPVLEDMPPDKLNDDETEAVLLENKTQALKKLDNSKIKKETKLSTTCEKVTRSIATKKTKEITKIVSKEKDSAPASPLPGLVVETEKTRQDDLTSSIEANLLQKFKKIYTDVHDLNQTDDTRHLLLKAGENDDAVFATEIIGTALVSTVLSERSIATGGRSPIISHNDLNESPPNFELLDEVFQHRDMYNEDMSESMTAFRTNTRNQLQNNKPTARLTSPVIPITRMSTKESVRSNLCAKRMSSEESIHKSIAYAGSNKSNPKVVSERIPIKEIKSKLDPIGSPKSKVSSVVLNRLSSEEIEKYMSRNKTTSDTGSPKIVLERISSDEINRWLPMPESKDVVDTIQRPKKYTTRQTLNSPWTVKKPTETKIPTKQQTSKPAETKTLTNVIEQKIKPKISPVKLNFDMVDLTMSTDYRLGRALRTRSCTKSTKSQATNIDEETLKTVSIKSSVPKAQTSKNDQSFIKNSQETSKSSVVTRSKPDKALASVDRCDARRSIASVQDWLQRNATPSSQSAADNHASQEMLCQMMETLQTTLAEIHRATSERFAAALLKDKEEIASLEKEVQDVFKRLLEKIAELKQNQMDRRCQVIRADAEEKARMVRLLQEDIQRIFN